MSKKPQMYRRSRTVTIQRYCALCNRSITDCLPNPLGTANDEIVVSGFCIACNGLLDHYKTNRATVLADGHKKFAYVDAGKAETAISKRSTETAKRPRSALLLAFGALMSRDES